MAYGTYKSVKLLLSILDGKEIFFRIPLGLNCFFFFFVLIVRCFSIMNLIFKKDFKKNWFLFTVYNLKKIKKIKIYF